MENTFKAAHEVIYEQATIKNAIDKDSEIASRRRFLKQIACGSLLAMSGTGIATATVKDIIRPGSNYGHGRTYGYGHTPPVNSGNLSLRSRIFTRDHQAGSFLLTRTQNAVL